MAADNNPKLRLYQDYYSEAGMTDENSLARALLTQADQLSPVLTHLQGQESKKFPLSYLTEGMGHIKYVKDQEYNYPVIGRLDKAVRCLGIEGSGINNTIFYLYFNSKWFIKQYLIEGPNEIQARILEDGVETTVPGGTGIAYKYKVQFAGSDLTQSLSPADVLNTDWVQMFAPVAQSGSRGNESNWVAPSKMTNQLTNIRKSYRFEGNAQNKVVNVEFNVPGKQKTSLWWDYEEFQHSLKWQEECESAWWYSRYNRLKNGEIMQKDENGKPIPLGSGVLEQIPNKDTYGILTAEKIKSVVREALFGATDTDNMNIIMYTGTGGLEAFDDAMKDTVANGGFIKNTAPASFITGSGRNLTLGGFFTSYKHIDGHTITVRHLPLLDHGARSRKSPKHPITGLPLESYRMIFLDHSMYDGENNIVMVTEKGRQFARWAVAGREIPKGFEKNASVLRATDKDGSSVHFMKSGGIQIRRATNCMHLTCELS